MSNQLIRQFEHSCYTKNDTEDAVVVRETVKKQDGTIVPKLTIIKNPKRSFWVTKPAYRNHTFKKEYCDKSELDEYVVYNKDLEKELFKVVNGYYPKKPMRLRNICNSPFVYGADINIEVLVKSHYIEKFGDNDMIPISTGFLDIEASVLKGSEGTINLITVTHETKVYTAILDAFFYKSVQLDSGEKVKVKGTLEELNVLVQRELSQHINKYGFTFEFKLCKTELELITWIFSCIHKNKTSFIGIWNMNFDIPAILDAIKRNNGDELDIIPHPEVPKNLRKVNYHLDKRMTDHFTDKWHWFHTTGYSQFVDSLNLYSRLRKVKGYETSYTLNYILNKELGLSKLSLGDEESHYIMQSERFLDYVVYNIFDAMSLQIMEWQNTDITSMLILSDVSTLPQFGMQTVMTTNGLYIYAKKFNKVPASAGTDMVTEYDKLIKNTGGTVLNPERSIGSGINALEERDVETMLHAFVSDVDFAAFYPRATCGANISKETKLSTALQIEGHTLESTQTYFSSIISPKENAVFIMQHYFGLPGYEEIEKLFIDA